MIRLMVALFAFLWSAILDTKGGAGGGGGSEADGAGNPEKFELTADELTNRTNAAAASAAQAKQKEIAELLGIDPEKIADAKGLIEAGRKANQPADDDKPAGEESNIKDTIAELLKPFTERLGQIEQTEQQRQQEAAEQARNEKLTAALKDANVREDRMSAALTIALANGAKLDDKGELEGSKEAIEATKRALPEAFRGDGDDGKAADANGQERTDRKPKNLTEALTAHYSKS